MCMWETDWKKQWKLLEEERYKEIEQKHPDN